MKPARMKKPRTAAERLARKRKTETTALLRRYVASKGLPWLTSIAGVRLRKPRARA